MDQEETKSLENPEDNLSISKFWDEFSSIYTSQAEILGGHIDLSLGSMARVMEAKTILECACGSGFGSLSIS